MHRPPSNEPTSKNIMRLSAIPMQGWSHLLSISVGSERVRKQHVGTVFQLMLKVPPVPKTSILRPPILYFAYMSPNSRQRHQQTRGCDQSLNNHPMGVR